MDETLKNILLLSLIAFFANLVFGLTAFGAAIVFQCSWHIMELAGVASGGINEGTKHIAVLMFVTRGMQAINLRNHCVSRLAVIMLCGCIPALVLGTLIAYSIPSKTVEVIVGVIFLLILSFNLSSKGVRLPPPLVIGDESSVCGGNRNHIYALMSASLASGLLMGVCGTPGPPFMVLLTSYASVEPVIWRGTAAVVQWTVGVVQLVLLYSMVGSLSNNMDDILVDVLMIVGGLLGLWVGNSLSSTVDAEWVGKAMIVFLSMSSASMITSLASVSVQLFALLFAAVLTLGVIIWHSVTENRRAEEARVRADTVAFSKVSQSEDLDVVDIEVSSSLTPLHEGHDVEVDHTFNTSDHDVLDREDMVHDG